MFFLDFLLGLGLNLEIRLDFRQCLGLDLGLGLMNRWGPPRSSTFLGENRQRMTTKSRCLQIVLLLIYVVYMFFYNIYMTFASFNLGRSVSR